MTSVVCRKQRAERDDGSAHRRRGRRRHSHHIAPHLLPARRHRRRAGSGPNGASATATLSRMAARVGVPTGGPAAAARIGAASIPCGRSTRAGGRDRSGRGPPNATCRCTATSRSSPWRTSSASPPAESHPSGLLDRHGVPSAEPLHRRPRDPPPTLDVVTLGTSRSTVCLVDDRARPRRRIGPVWALRDSGSALTLGLRFRPAIDLVRGVPSVEHHQRLASPGAGNDDASLAPGRHRQRLCQSRVAGGAGGWTTRASRFGAVGRCPPQQLLESVVFSQPRLLTSDYVLSCVIVRDSVSRTTRSTPAADLARAVEAAARSTTVFDSNCTSASWRPTTRTTWRTVTQAASARSPPMPTLA